MEKPLNNNSYTSFGKEPYEILAEKMNEEQKDSKENSVKKNDKSS